MRTRFILALDLSSHHGTLALGQEANSRCRVLDQELLPEGRHSESLIPGLRRLLERQKLTLPSIDSWVVNEGPGSFTGLRIAIATLKAIVLVHPRPIVAVDGSEVRALAGWSGEAPCGICVLTQLTSKRCLEAHFRIDGERLRKVEPDKVFSWDEGWKPPEGELLFADTGTDAVLKRAGTNSVRVDSEARHLLEHYLRCSYLKTAESKEEIIALAPQYAGSRFGKQESGVSAGYDEILRATPSG
jgi:tRNA threonylcarbamoyladenosine biosynthesis protein TsaB